MPGKNDRFISGRASDGEKRMLNEERLTPTPKRRNSLLLAVGLAFLGFAAAFLLFGGSLFDRVSTDAAANAGSSLDAQSIGTPQPNNNAFTLPANALKVGDAAPNFVLADADGNRVALDDFTGQPIILNFWATWCPPCRIEMPDLQQAHQDYQAEDLVILAVNKDESAETVRDFFYDEMGLTFTPLLDPGSTIGDLFGAFNLPTTFFINSSGEITAVHRGAMTAGQIEGYLAQTIP